MSVHEIWAKWEMRGVVDREGSVEGVSGEIFEGMTNMARII